MRRLNSSTLALSAVTCGVLALTACGGDDEDAAPTTVESSDAVTGDLPRFESTAEIRDKLAGTDWECQVWNDSADTGEVEGTASSCLTAIGGGENRDQPSIHAIYLNDHPAETASVIFQGQSPAVIVGNNWLFDCGPDTAISIDQCKDIARILGGTVVLPDPV
ncbi:hypothetical protein [Corynebacterium variabile]|uniref:hypothetical protein n=1 Tax=Corynebacterium variabile TaxID=1727 RepID=UPI002647B746|nr:hypothetical protein [Corynebacterium variabile]MDN6242175.1 hypothetical protein [Corynebacterium variabile]MDN6677153.1 hypothetical protein [Corynebacterium variabile]MDN6845304.1 hypothetical protein [Corynebacterium variabile]